MNTLHEPHLVNLRGLWLFEFLEGDIELDADGRRRNPVVMSESYENLITTAGKALVLNRVYGLSAVIALSNTGVGTSNTAAAIGDTGLTAGVWKGYDSTAILSTLTVTSVTTYTTAEANIVIAEAALSNGSPATSAGTILNRLAPIGPFTKSASVSLSITVTVTQT